MVVPEGTDAYEYQFVFIREALKPYFVEIEASDEPMAELAYAMYAITHQYVEGIVDTIPNVKVCVIGGIQINVPQPCGDLFAPLMFEIRKHGEPVKDLLPVFSEVAKYH